MNWFFIALVAPLLYAISNHTDKYLISKYIHDNKVGALIIFSALFGVFALPIILIINPLVLGVSLGQGIILMIIGVLVVLSILCYLYALQFDEATFVVPFYQMIPIFGFILAYFILGETLTKTQIIASLAILLGALILSFDIQDKKIRFKKKVVLLMSVASFFYAMSDVLFKFVAIERGFWVSTFWTLVGKVLIGIIFLIFISSYRSEFFLLIKEAKGKILALNSMNETLTIVADMTVQYAILLAPVALVLMVNGFQPLFVFVIGLGLTLFFPHISQEKIQKKHLIQKIGAILIMLIGSCFL
ncbi:MAG: EamA family transporter [Patescibacteria group bacterium]